MSEELKRIEKLEKLLAENGIIEEFGEKIPTYSFSKIKFEELKKLVKIHQNFIDDNIFDDWFLFVYDILDDDIIFLKKLIDKNIKLINLYREEDLKVNFIVPLINKIDYFFIKDNIRNFYNEKLTYKTDKFIFNGETDFMVSKGLIESEKPYFFIQKFKKGFVNTNPEPQLLAELISAIEINNEITIKGAYIIGATWNFVILEKLGKNKYQYFVSRDFNCTNIIDLKDIYKNLLFIKNEIIEIIKNTN